MTDTKRRLALRSRTMRRAASPGTVQFRNFHAGEARLQAESGINTAEYDRNVDQPFLPELNDSEVRFVGQRSFSVAASLDDTGQPWVSPLIGPPGELFTVEDRTTVRVRPRRTEGDPLYENLRATGSMGILYFNPSIRRRAKSLGRGVIEGDGSITYRMHRMFGLCPKYIFKRSHVVSDEPTSPSFAPTRSDQLSSEDQAQLSRADTIFLASHSEEHGTDPTHRGGPSGFVSVVDANTLEIPEYIGNGMFQTLGNLLLDDRIGLTSLDFATGRTVQVTGRGTILAADPSGVRTNRTLRIEIDQVRTTAFDIGEWTDIEPFMIDTF